MRRWLALLVVAIPAAVVALLWTSPPSQAQPVTPPGLKVVTHGSSMSGSGTVAAPLDLRADCDSSEVLAWDGDSWECAASGGSCTDLGFVCSTNTDCCSGYCGDGVCSTGAPAAGTNIDVSGSTVSVEPTISLAGESNVDTLEVFNSATNQTANVRGVDVAMTGTYDGTVVTATYAGYFSNTMTVSDPETPLGGITNYGIYAKAEPVYPPSNGVWYAVYADGPTRTTGTATFDGQITNNGDTTLGNASGDTLLVNATSQFENNITLGSSSADTLTVNATTTHAAPTTMTDLRGTVQTTSSTGAINDFSLNSDTTVLVLTGAAPALTGITGGAAGRLLLLVNTNTTATATLAHETTSTSINRFQIQSGQTHTLGSGLTWLYYDGTLSRWVVADDRYVSTLTVTGSGLFIAGLTSSSTSTLGDSNDDVTSVRMPKDSGTAPTLSSCGTSPTITGGSWAFTITAGTGGITACTATFAATKTNAPTCIATQRSSSESVYLSSVSATAITITARSGTTDLSSDVIDVICIGDA